MSIARETIMQALFDLLNTPGTYKTSSRRLKFWQDVTAQPALFVRHVGDEVMPRATRIPGKLVIEAEAWVYSKGGADPDVAPETSLNALLDSIEAAIQPAAAQEVQTLGGLVTHCWIEGKIELHPGDIGGQAIAVVPIRMLVPTLRGPAG